MNVSLRIYAYHIGFKSVSVVIPIPHKAAILTHRLIRYVSVTLALGTSAEYIPHISSAYPAEKRAFVFVTTVRTFTPDLLFRHYSMLRIINSLIFFKHIAFTGKRDNGEYICNTGNEYIV
jgi:hypothetical protein